MKKLFTTGLLLIAAVCTSMAATISISNVGSTFSPSTTTAEVGDIIEFTLSGGIHNATRVSQSTWNSNGTTSNGGFAFSGNGTFQYTVVAGDIGTIYYVCTNHVGGGMKGQITVTAATGVVNKSSAAELTIYPNPTSGTVTLDNSEAANVKVYNQSGILVREIYVEKNGQLDLSGLANGVYFITAINTNGKESRGKIVKK